MPKPTRAPAFEPLMRSVLEALGWSRTRTDTRPRSSARWGRPGYPEIEPPWQSGLPPEVIFRVLDELRIGFAEPVEDLMASVKPNAAHHIAARLLQAGGVVWTPNIDTGVERAWAELTGSPSSTLPRSLGRLTDRGLGYPERDFSDARAGALVKFHGSADVHGSLAFTDRQLLAPLPDHEVDRLAEMATGFHLIFYGYRGADADLHDLLRIALERAAKVTWLVASPEQQTFVAATFPGKPVTFLPEALADDWTRDAPACAAAFLELMDSEGLTDNVDEVSRALFVAPHSGDPPPAPEFSRLRPPALVNAVLVERFGSPRDHRQAILAALREDVGRLRHPATWPSRNAALDAARGYTDWWFTWSLYHDGIVAKAIAASAAGLRHRSAQRIAALPLLKRRRDLVLDKAPALLLSKGRWDDLRELMEYAVSVRDEGPGLRRPNDVYYLGHALRYAGEIAAARDAQDYAEIGLSGRRAHRPDPERLAGVVLEQGILDLYQGRFQDALVRAQDLKDIRGRYAIQRWAAWGHWLAGTTFVYLLELPLAAEELRIAGRWFNHAGEPRHVNDVALSRLLRLRVSGGLEAAGRAVDVVRRYPLSPRQRDDLQLLEADITLASGHADAAATLIAPVLKRPTNRLSHLWARLISAEIDRVRRGDTKAAIAVRDDAHRTGATWLELQAVAVLARNGDDSARRSWFQLASSMQLGGTLDGAASLQLGDHPALWALT